MFAVGRDQPSFTLEPDEMILGLGIHGEAGVKRMPLGSAAVAVKVCSLTLEVHTNRKDHWQFSPDDKINSSKVMKFGRR